MSEREEVRLLCDRRLSGHRRQAPRDLLIALAASSWADLPSDSYGEGAAIASLEGDVAKLLGKPVAVFMIKGVVAQQAALRVWSDRSGSANVALHPKSHIDLDERSAYERLHGLRGVRLGPDHKPYLASDLAAAGERLGAAVVELPLRRAGYKLPEWDELVALSEWCRAQRVPLHFDGARLWEAQPYYAKPLHEIAALADSVYVSFYKGLAGLGGAVLAGPETFIAEARVWQARHCGALMTAFPFVVSAIESLKLRLPRMLAYYERAQTLSSALVAAPDAGTIPGRPQCNAFQLYLDAPAAALEAAHLALARETGVWLFDKFSETMLPELSMAEIWIGDAAEDIDDDEAAALISRLVTMAPTDRRRGSVGVTPA